MLSPTPDDPPATATAPPARLQLLAIGLVVGAALVGACLRGPASGGLEERASGQAPPAFELATAHTTVRAPSSPPPALPEGLWSDAGCTASSCHAGIEPIRRPETGMFRALVELGQEHGDPDGCIVCHGGDPKASAAAEAHRGAPPSLKAAGGADEFFADPASPWVNERTCGLCHPALVRAQWTSLMMTEAGKIQGTTWSFGAAADGYEHTWANYAVENPDDPGDRIGTDAYRQFMAEKTAAHPNIFVDAHEPLPEAPTAETFDDVRRDPSKAVFTYIRGECQRCHLGVKGRARRGDYRGMGCGACHIPYSNEGLYEGGDQTVPESPGHMLVHSIQGTRDAAVIIDRRKAEADIAEADAAAADAAHALARLSYSGIPIETCTTCHNRGKRIGVSYQGLMEAAWDSPYTEGGGGQPELHSKHYIAMEKDIHAERGMLCQDCHTSGDVHSDGFLAGANLGAVEIECADCHGTPDRFPWELPLGYGDENGPEDIPGAKEASADKGPPRGVAAKGSLSDGLKRGAPAPGEHDGHLLTARGNPFPEIVRVGDRIRLHLASGRDLWLDPLRLKVDQGALSREAEVAMVHASKHIDTMECYSCHSSWAPQCYGCHVEIDYSKAETFDWVAAGRKHQEPAHRTDRGEAGYDLGLLGKVTEMRSYMRWEDPPLGINGEGRVSPLIPGCQVSATVKGPYGEVLTLNKIARTPAGTEGGGAEGQLAIDMSPVHPHTVGKARSCESCHGSAKALGYGIGGGTMSAPWDSDKVVDLATADGQVIPKAPRTQIAKIAGLVDWSAVITPEGQQTQTIGHHFRGSGPLSDAQRQALDRHDVCIGCHQEIPEASLAVDLLHHVAEVTGGAPKSRTQHESLLRGVLLTSAWVEVLGALGLVLAAVGGAVFVVRRRRRRR